MVEIGKEPQKEEIAVKVPTTCDMHQDKEIELFCLECQLAICMMCFVKSHKTHDCSDIEEASIEHRKQVKSDRDKIADLLEKYEEILPRFEKQNNELVNRLAHVESEVNKAADKLIAAVERDRAILLSAIEPIRLEQTNQLLTVKHGVEQHVAALKSFKQHSEIVLSGGTACDVTRLANSLHNSAEELMMFDVINYVDSSLPSLSINFTPCPRLGVENLVGTIAEEGLWN